MSKINWELVDREIFAEFRFAKVDEIAQAYFDEALAEEPDNNRLITLYEIGQGRFSAHYNSREFRERLFSNFVGKIYTAHELSSASAKASN